VALMGSPLAPVPQADRSNPASTAFSFTHRGWGKSLQMVSAGSLLGAAVRLQSLARAKFHDKPLSLKTPKKQRNNWGRR
jgi:hypothetical protein